MLLDHLMTMTGNGKYGQLIEMAQCSEDWCRQSNQQPYEESV